MSPPIRIGPVATVVDGGDGMRFPLSVGGRAATGFVVRHRGTLFAYLNRCAHVSMELDWQPGRFFDADGEWLVCATHGALYEPATGRCAGGPCAGRGGLRAIALVERDGVLYWQPDGYLEPPLPEPEGLRE
jgi:nitrite reductase/ring-hydroxylating ferredoxin subunit